MVLAWPRNSLGCSSNTAITAGSPAASPAATNWVASALLPEPAGPVTSSESQAGMPPPSISSSAATPVDRRLVGRVPSGSRRAPHDPREDLQAVAR